MVEAGLVAGLRCGNGEAFEELVLRYQRRVRAMVARLLENEEDTDEVTQDVFMSVFRRIDRFEERSTLGSWIYRIAVNSALMKLRARKRRKYVSFVPCDELPDVPEERLDVESLLLHRERLLETKRVIGDLPEKFKQVLILRDVYRASGKEVANTLELSEAAVKSRLHRARDMLRRRLENSYTTDNLEPEFDIRTSVNGRNYPIHFVAPGI